MITVQVKTQLQAVVRQIAKRGVEMRLGRVPCLIQNLIMIAAMTHLRSRLSWEETRRLIRVVLSRRPPLFV